MPVIPGSDDYITNVNDAVGVANKIGYPILLKAAAGGGGKGIRRINDHNQMRQIFSEAQNEARLSFNDDRMYLEKIMENVKHIEVQVFVIILAMLFSFLNETARFNEINKN